MKDVSLVTFFIRRSAERLSSLWGGRRRRCCESRINTTTIITIILVLVNTPYFFILASLHLQSTSMAAADTNEKKDGADGGGLFAEEDEDEKDENVNEDEEDGAESSSHFQSDAHVSLVSSLDREDAIAAAAKGGVGGKRKKRRSRSGSRGTKPRSQRMTTSHEEGESDQFEEGRGSSTKSSTHPSSSEGGADRPHRHNRSSDDAQTVDTWEFTIASSVHQPLIPPGLGGGGGSAPLGGGTANKVPPQRGSATAKPRSASLPRQGGTGRILPSSFSKPRLLLPPPIANPRLAELTMNKLQFSKLGRLYGRERPIGILRAAWEEVHVAAAEQRSSLPRMPWDNEEDDFAKMTGSAHRCAPEGAHRHLVAVAGPSGAGKSALAEALRPVVECQGGFFLTGKCPQPPSRSKPSSCFSTSSSTSFSLSSSSVPFAAFAAACHELCERLVADSACSSGSTAGGGGGGLDDSENINFTNIEDSHRSTTEPDYDAVRDDNGAGGGADHSDKWGSRRAPLSPAPSTSLPHPTHQRPRFTVTHLRERLHRDLGDDASSMLVRVIPGLLLLLGSNCSNNHSEGDGGEHDTDTMEEEETVIAPKGGPAAPAPEGLESPHRFRYAFRKFLRCITSLGPVTFVLDDLQWADAASLELLEALVSDRENPALLVVACYRTDDDVAPGSDAAGAIDAAAERFANNENTKIEEDATSITTATTTSTSAKTGAMIPHGPYRQTLENLRRLAAEDRAVAVDDVSIGNLAPDQVCDLLVDLLSSSESEVQPLAECVHRKTHGNVFFVIQYLTLVHELDLLVFHLGTLQWTWDLPAIQASTSSTDNVVSLVKTKLLGLPRALRRVLPLAACLGPALSEHTLRLVLERWVAPWGHAEDDDESQSEVSLCDPSTMTAASLLSQCEREGLLELHGTPEEGTYLWVHDKIQEAAFSLIGEAELRTVRRHLSRILMEGLDASALEQNLFTVANLWSPDHLSGSAVKSSLPLSDLIPVARLYLRAGHKASEGSAFEAAGTYLAAGIKLLPPDLWPEHRVLRLDLLSSAAEAEFGAGNFERMRTYCDAVIGQQDLSLMDKRRAYNVLIESMAAQERFSDAFALTKTLLEKLGCTFPSRAIPIHVIMGIAWVKTTLKKHVTQGLSHLPPMKDEVKLWTMFLLDKFSTYTYLEKSDLLPLTIFKRLRLTISDGLSPFAPAAFSSIGMVLAAFLHDYNGGLSCVEQALEHLNLIPFSRKVEPRVLFVSHAFVLHWLRPLKLSLKPLLHSYEVGMATGDTESAAWSLLFYLELCLSTGTPLDRMSTDIAFYVEQLREVKQLNVLVPLSTLWQTVLHLSGKNEYTGGFSGDVFDADEAIRNANQNVDNVRAGISVRVMYLSFLFGNHEAVFQCIKDTGMDKGTYDKLFPGAWVVCPLYTFNAMSLISLYRKSRNRKYLRIARLFAKKVKGWAAIGVRSVPPPHRIRIMPSPLTLHILLPFFSSAQNPNVIHFDALLDAEFASLRGDSYTSSTRFEVAIQYSARSGLTQDRALAHERYGEHLLRLGTSNTEDAVFHLSEALKLYEEWGALGKVRRIQAVHGSWFAPASSVQLELPF